jgi:uncharacterized protein with GYD domain
VPKYLVRARYTTSGLQGVLAEGGTGRREAIAKTIANAGGELESFYFAFGDEDAYVTLDAPDNVTTAAVSMMVSASGAAECRVTVLLTPEEVDEATRVSVDYRPPGD